jgi:hypothetical protein
LLVCVLPLEGPAAAADVPPRFVTLARVRLVTQAKRCEL